MKKSLPLLLASVLCSLIVTTHSARAQTTAFTYQGRLTENGMPANSSNDFTFTLYNAASGGATVGTSNVVNDLAVTNGLFTATLNFTAAPFDGSDRWLQIAVRPGASTGAYTNLVPRQAITATPYAITAGNLSGALSSASLSGTYPNAVTLNNGANSFSGNGAGLTNLNASRLASGTLGDARLSANVALRSGGNAFTGNQTVAGSVGIGTTAPTRPLEIQATGDVELGLKSTDLNGRLWTLQSSGNGTPGREQTFQIIDRTAGASRLLINPNGNVGIGTASPASALDVNGVVSASSDVSEAFQVRGASAGYALYDRVPAEEDTHWVMFASGGTLGFYNAIPRNTVMSVSPDGDVTARSFNGTVGTPLMLGTTDNQPLEFKVNNQRALRLEPTAYDDTVNVIGGSARNFVRAGVAGATIGGGGAGDYFGDAYTNRVEADFSTVSGGRQNTIQSSAYSATIGGGENNTIQTNANRATIGGGGGNTIQTGAGFATIGGGDLNTIEVNAYFATIGGGRNNMIQTDSFAATIGGGSYNTIQTNAVDATIAGGGGNTIQSGSYNSSIGGGFDNTNSGTYATIPGGAGNSAANCAFAAGYRAKANHTGAFVWADCTDADFASTGDKQFLIRAAGGVGINTNNPNGAALAVNGPVTATSATTEGFEVSVAAAGYALQDRAAPGAAGRWVMYADNGRLALYNAGFNRMTLTSAELRVNGAFVSNSDRNVKSGFERVEAKAILEKVASLPITRWHYTNDTATTHLGPMAQDFRAAFAIGHDDKGIATVDADGVALAAIQGLNQKVEGEVTALRAENAELKQRLEKLEALMTRENGRAR